MSGAIAALSVGPAPRDTRTLDAIGGIEITDIDLSEPLTPALRSRVARTFRSHPVLVFRGQNLTKPRQYDFTLNFGEIEGLHVGRLVDSERYGAVHLVSWMNRVTHPPACVNAVTISGTPTSRITQYHP
jgi:alpha-ketoglutarate-dependent taurine dioxygenase